MGKVTGGMAISIDGYANDKNGDTARLYPDFEALGASEVLQESIRDTRAVLMGRRSFDMAHGDLTGYEYPVPIFVVTHDPPKTPIKGENDSLRVHFVTQGVEEAVARAKKAAGSRDVTVVGGVDVLRQLLAKGLLDELSISVVPVLLGGGLRFRFDGLDDSRFLLEQTRVLTSPGRTDIFYRVKRQAPAS